MPLGNQSYKVQVNELPQPHRFNWSMVCNGNPPCGWQAHAYKEDEIVGISVHHLVTRHGYSPDQAKEAIAVIKLAAPPASVPQASPAATDKSRTHVAAPTPVNK